MARPSKPVVPPMLPLTVSQVQALLDAEIRKAAAKPSDLNLQQLSDICDTVQAQVERIDAAVPSPMREKNRKWCWEWTVSADYDPDTGKITMKVSVHRILCSEKGAAT